MQELHRALQRDLARAHDEALAAHAAQVRQQIAGRKPAAVDDHVAIGGGALAPNCTSAPARRASPSMKAMRRRRRHVRLLGKEERRAKAPFEVGLEALQRLRIEALVALRALGEALELNAVARGGDDEAAGGNELGIERAPQPPRPRSPARASSGGAVSASRSGASITAA